MISKTALAAIAAVIATGAGSAGSATLYSNDFETNTAGVTGGGAVVGSEGLAGFGFGTQYLRNETTLSGPSQTPTVVTFSAGGAGASGASLAFSFATIDSWDGNTFFGPDTFSVALDNTVLFSAIFDVYNNTGPTVAPGLASLSYGTNLAYAGFNDGVYTLTLALGNLSAGAHTVSFYAGGTGWQGGSDESLGLDNIVVTGSVNAVPEPGTVALMALGLAGLGLAVRRRRA